MVQLRRITFRNLLPKRWRRRPKASRGRGPLEKTTESVLKRSIIPKEKRNALLSDVEKKLDSHPQFFNTLPKAGKHHFVRLYEFNGVPVVIKDTRGEAKEGLDFRELQRMFITHQKAVQQGAIRPRGYRLIMPEIYGEIKGRYVVMELMSEKSIEEIMGQKKGRLVEKSRRSHFHARQNLGENLSILRGGRESRRETHIKDTMIVGNTNPKKPHKGDWIISLALDFLK